jgi:hypothetical protein
LEDRPNEVVEEGRQCQAKFDHVLTGCAQLCPQFDAYYACNPAAPWPSSLAPVKVRSGCVSNLNSSVSEPVRREIAHCEGYRFLHLDSTYRTM